MTPDFAKMMQSYGAIDYTVFNGYANQYVEHPIAVKVGEPIRIFVVNAGPNVWSSFHVGAIFDAGYLNANPNNKLERLQSHASSLTPGSPALKVKGAVAQKRRGCDDLTTHGRWSSSP